MDHMLRKDYDVTFVPNVDEALEAVESESFDLLLLDINLGEGRDGADLLHLIREREDASNSQAVALTAYAMPGDRDEFLDQGFDGYLSKPFTRAQLMAVIEENLP